MNFLKLFFVDKTFTKLEKIYFKLILKNSNKKFLKFFSPKYQPISPEEFVPTDTSPSDIWYLKSSEKLKIPCHKYLLLLHSRQIGAMQRFHSNYGNFGDFKDGKSENEVEIEANASVETVKNALRGMINIRTLFKIKTIEVIGFLVKFEMKKYL